MKISACLIIKNEADCLAKCLASLHKYVDEIVVADTGSTDGSRQVAASYGAVVYDYKWQDDFAAARNFVKAKASGDWILFLDADECFVNNSAVNLRSVIAEFGSQCDGFMLKLINIDADNNDAYLDEFYTMRIFKNVPELRYKNKIHEELHHISGRLVKLIQVNPVSLCLHHTGYSSGKIKQKCQRNLAALLSGLTGTEQDKYLYRYLADAYNGIGDYENALKYAKLDIATGRKELSYASRSYRIVQFALHGLNASAAERCLWYEKSIAAFPKLPDFPAYYAYFLYTLGEYDRAIAYVQQAFELASSYDEVEASLFHNNRQLYHLLLGILYTARSDYALAEPEYAAAVHIDRFYQPSFQAWYDLLSKHWPQKLDEKLAAVYDDAAGRQFLSARLDSQPQPTVSESILNAKGAEWTMEEKIDALQKAQQFYQDCLLCAAIMQPPEQPLQFPLVQQRIWDAVNGQGALSDEDFTKYIGVLNALLVSCAGQVLLERYLSVQHSFTVDNIILLADKLAEYNEYALAGQVYKVLLEYVQDTEKLLTVTEKLAEALYYGGDDQNAAAYFQFLYENGTAKTKYRFYLQQLGVLAGEAK